MDDIRSLAHTTWKCQYHIVFTPKYHRKVIYGAFRTEIGKILRELCKRKGVEIIEAHAMPDHIHMLVTIPGKSTMIIFERYARLKYKYGNRHFWSRGYYVSTNTKERGGTMDNTQDSSFPCTEVDLAIQNG